MFQMHQANGPSIRSGRFAFNAVRVVGPVYFAKAASKLQEHIETAAGLAPVTQLEFTTYCKQINALVVLVDNREDRTVPVRRYIMRPPFPDEKVHLTASWGPGHSRSWR